MDQKLWEKAVAFHGHECPGLAIGFKACEAVREKMGIGVSDDEQLVCVTENDACGVDAPSARQAAASSAGADSFGSEQGGEVIGAMKSWQKDLNSRTKDIPDGKKPSVYAGAVSFRGGHGIEGTYGKYPPFTAIHAKNVVDETGKSGGIADR